MPESQNLLPSGLTPKQQKFTNIVVKQIIETGKPNLVQAALQTYDTKSYSAAGVSGHENLKNPKVKATILEALDEVGLTNKVLAKNLKYFANARPKKISADVALKGNIELLKLVGAYPTQKHANISLSLRANLNKMDYKEVQTELGKIDEELKRLMNDTPSLDDASKEQNIP